MKCDLCEEESVETDTWFNTNRCQKHINISPVEGQRILRERLKEKL